MCRDYMNLGIGREAEKYLANLIRCSHAVEDDFTLLWHSSDLEGKAHKDLQTLRCQLKLGREMGLAARSYVERHFNRRDQAEVFSGLLQRVVA